MIKACIFDLDGTLLDTLSAIGYFVNLHMRKHGLKELDAEMTRAFVGDGARNLIIRALGASGIDTATEEGGELLSHVLPEYVEDYNRDPYFMTSPYPGIENMLSELKRRGILLGILSNKPDSTVKLLAQRFFPGVFDIVRGAVDGVPLKPAPDAALAMCERLGVTPSEVAYFGDTAVDIRTAKAFGALLGAAVLWGFRTREELLPECADVYFDSADEITKKIFSEGNV